MEYQLQSKYRDADFAPRTLLVREQVAQYTPYLGTVLGDRFAESRDVRTYSQQTVVFDDIHAWHIEDAVLTDEFIVHRGAEVFVDSSILSHYDRQERLEQVLDGFAARLAAHTAPPILDYANETALVIHNEGGWTWGHYLVQNFPKILLYLRHFPEGRIVLPKAFRVGADNNFARMFEEFGIGGDRQILIEPARSYRFRELVILDFLFDFRSMMAHPLAIDMLSCSGSITGPRGSAGGGIAIERSSEWRSIANPAACDAVLHDHGVTSRKLGSEALADQIGAWRGERFFVATLGSDLANMVFGQPGSRVLALSPDWFGDRFFYNLAVAKGMQWNELRCGELGTPHPRTRHLSSFKVDPARLDVMLSTLAPLSLRRPSVRQEPADGAARTAGIVISAHVRNIGDVRGVVGDWAGATAAELWIEGFTLTPWGGLRADEFACQAVFADGTLSAAVPGGGYCGTRGAATPLAGFVIRLTDAAARAWRCSYSGRFADGSEVGPLDAGARCQTPDLAPLAAMRISVTRVCAR